MAQWDQRCLGSAGSQVQSLAGHSELKIPSQCCPRCSLGCDCGLDLIPGLGIPYSMRQPKMKKKKKVSLTIISEMEHRGSSCCGLAVNKPD